ncbi:MAG: sensor histidine kinase [Promethearchaeota archaeon]
MNNPQKNPNMEKINLAYRAAFNSSNWKELQQNILSAVVDPRAVSTRLILIPSNFSPVFPPVSEGIGPKSESFGYLDKEIMNQLEKQQRIFIPDTSKFRTIKFLKEKEYPKSILGFKLKIESDFSSSLWYAYNFPLELTRRDLLEFEELVKAVSEVEDFYFSREKNQLYHNLFQGIIDSFEFPVIMTDSRGFVLFSNISPQNRKDFTEGELLRKNLLEKIPQDNDNFTIQIGEKNYLATVRKLPEFKGSIYFAFIFIDQTQTKQKSEYFYLIIDMINQDLKSNLTEAKGYLKMLPLIGMLNEEQKKYLEIINSINFRAISLIDELFSVRKIKNSELLEFKPTDIISVIKQAVQLIEPKSNQNRVKLNMTELVGTSNMVLGDKTLLMYSIYDVMKFAIDQSSPGKEVVVGSEINRDNYLLSVSDFGCGFSKVDVETFNAGSSKNPDFEPLSVASRIIKMHQGNLILESTLGSGTKYKVKLPLT